MKLVVCSSVGVGLRVDGYVNLLYPFHWVMNIMGLMISQAPNTWKSISLKRQIQQLAMQLSLTQIQFSHSFCQIEAQHWNLTFLFFLRKQLLFWQIQTVLEIGIQEKSCIKLSTEVIQYNIWSGSLCLDLHYGIVNVWFTVGLVDYFFLPFFMSRFWLLTHLDSCLQAHMHILSNDITFMSRPKCLKPTIRNLHDAVQNHQKIPYLYSQN